MLKSLMDYFRSREKWETIFFSENVDEYSKVKGLFNNENIKSKTKITHNPFGYSSYEISVKESDMRKANELVHPL